MTVPDQIVRILYTNWKHETRKRLIKPIHIYFGSTEYHPNKQWLLYAFDMEKEEHRTYAMADIYEWASGEELGDPG